VEIYIQNKYYLCFGQLEYMKDLSLPRAEDSDRSIQIGSERAHPASSPVVTRASFPGDKAGREDDHSPPSSAEVKNSWSHTSTPPLRLHGVVLS